MSMYMWLIHIYSLSYLHVWMEILIDIPTEVQQKEPEVEDQKSWILDLVVYNLDNSSHILDLGFSNCKIRGLD